MVNHKAMSLWVKSTREVFWDKHAEELMVAAHMNLFVQGRKGRPENTWGTLAPMAIQFRAAAGFEKFAPLSP